MPSAPAALFATCPPADYLGGDGSCHPFHNRSAGLLFWVVLALIFGYVIGVIHTEMRRHP
jgi:hypothetical protein